MKRLPAFFLLSLLFLPLSLLWAGEVYVSVTGSDHNPGTAAQPLASVAAALRKARELRRLQDPSIANGIHIIIKAGNYYFTEPLFVRPEDAGTAASPTYIEAAPGEPVIFSGGRRINGWQKVSAHVPGLPLAAQGRVWRAALPADNGRWDSFRQLWVNDSKAVRAKSTNGNVMDRILGWNQNEQTCTIPARDAGLTGVEGIEMFILQWWEIAVLRVKKMQTAGDSTKLYFLQPESRIQNEHPWPAPWLSHETGNTAFYLTNAIQFLDEPGEWWMDPVHQLVYYWPRSNENLLRDTVTAPLLENIVRIEGTADRRVSHVYFKNISFEHAGWARPGRYGHVPHQLGMYMLDAYKLHEPGTPNKATLENQAWVGRPAAAVTVSFADSTGFEACSFKHLAATGLDYYRAVRSNRIVGNLFKDIGGNAVLAGVYSDEAAEIHLPYQPKDESDVCTDTKISNNLITDAANEDWGCVGIGAGYTRNTSIDHNEIENVSYTGISMGWGWNPAVNPMRDNRITANKIHHYGKHAYDCSGIYILSAQPNTVISENEVDSIYQAPYAHLPSHWFYLYTDEGTSHVTVTNNWTASTKYLQNANGPGNQWVNNGPGVAQAIRNKAGLETGFQFLRSQRTTATVQQPVNTEHPEIIELLLKPGQELNVSKLKSFLQQNGMDSNTVYRWKNHYAIFGNVADLTVMQNKIAREFPGTKVKQYLSLLYRYEKATNCSDASVAAEWDHIVLTANLVAEPALQQEYINYHASQFEKWPEVARGFCNARFQRVLVFKNGRQLMLVISVPKGETLDTLNPLTTANNPRMVEWNNRMKKYQEGIEGTAQGETWVFLQPVK